MMDERDRIDIIATLHDRFNRPADEIIRKMERMEDQADKTGDEIDDLSDSLDKEARTTKDGTKALDENSKARDRNTDALDGQSDALSKAARNFSASADEVRKAVGPTQKHTKAVEEAASAASALSDATERANDVQVAQSETVRRAKRTMEASTRAVNRARDARGRFVRTTRDATETLRNHTKATEESTERTEENTEQTKKNRTAWEKWDARVRKIAGNAGKRFRPIGAFFQNYFKILGVFRAMLFSDIGAMIPQLITGIVAIGAAANATLAPLGRMLASLAQIAPLIAAFAQTQVVVKWAIGGVTDALKVLNNEKATLEELNAAMEEAGPNTWEMAKAVKVLGERFKPLKRLVRETFLDGLAPSVISLVDTYFPTLEKQLTRTADIMNGELKKGIKGLQTPEKQQTIANVMERSSEASGLFVDIMWSLLDVFLELADAAGPAFLETLEAIDGKLDKFAGWIRDNKEDLTDFFLSANDTAGEFFRGLGGILRGLHGISQAAKPLTDFMYGGLADRLVEWGDRMNDPAAQEEMTKNYEAMIPNLEAIGNLIGSVIEGAKEIATSEYFAPLINDLADNGIPMIVEYLKKLDETVGPPLLRMSQALDEMEPDVLTSILNPLGDALGLLATALEIVLPLFSALPKPMQKFVMYGLGLVAMGLPGIFMMLLSPISLLNLALKKLTGKGILGWAIEGFKKLGGVFEKLKNSKLGKFIGKLADQFKKLFKPIGDFMKKHVAKGGGGIIAKIFGKVAGKGILAFAGPVGVVIGVLWLLWDVISWLWKNVEPFREFMIAVWEGIKTAWGVSIDWIVNTAVPWIIDSFQSIWDKIKEVGQWIADFYNTWIKPVIDAIVKVGKIVFVTITTFLILPFVLLWNLIEPIVSGIIGWFQVAIPLALDLLRAKWEEVTDALVAAWEWVKNTFELAVDAIVLSALWAWEQMKNVAAWISNVWSTAWAWVRDSAAAAWAWIKDNVIAPVVNWFMSWVWPMIKMVIDWLVGAFHWLRDRVISVFSWIKNSAVKPVTDWFNTYVWPVIRNVLNWLGDRFSWLRDRVSNVWDAIKNKISTVYNEKIKPVIDSFKEAINALKDSFNVAKDAIGKAWDEIKNRAKTPIGFVIDNVYNKGIMPVWNKLADAVKLDTRLTEVTWAKDGYDTGGYTGPGSKYQPAGIVHADEFVIKKSSQRSLRREAPGLLDALNDHGAKALTGAGYAGGGWVKPFQGNYGINSGYGMRNGRMHSGVDYPLPTGTALTAVSDGQIVQRGWNPAAGNKISMSTDMKGIVAGYHHLSRYVAKKGDSVSKGQIIAYSGNTGRSSGPHLHFSIKRDGSYVSPVPYLRGSGAAGTGEGGGWSLPSIPNPFDGMLNRLLNLLPGKGGFKDIAVSATKAMVNGAKDFVADKLSYSNDWIYDTAGNVLDGGKSVLSAAGTAMWSGTAGKALQHTGDYSDANLHALLRRMNQESGGNPRAINLTDSNARRGTPSKGLMQVIDPTFRTYRDKNLSTDIYDPMANIVASINYAKSRYGNLQSAYNRKGGYFNGGLVDHMRFMGGPVETWGNTLVGELGPEIFLPSSGAPASLLGLGGPEVVSFNQEGTVLPHHAVAALASINSGSSGTVVEGDTIQVDIKVDGNASDQTVHDIRQAVRAAMAEIERKKKERR